ncbi:MAG: DUF2232 domain-containing protein [Inquilinaceae bacterium]
MGRAIAIAIVGGAVSAVFYLSILTGSSGAIILAYMTSLPLFLIGLSLGVPGGLIASATAAGAIAIAAGGLGALAYVAVNAAPVMLVVRQALRSQTDAAGNTLYYPPGPALLWLIGYGLVCLVIATVAMSGQPGGLSGVLADDLARMMEGLAPMLPPEMPPETIAGAMAPILPALMIIAQVLMTVLNGALAQGALMRFGRNLRPAMRMANVVLPTWLAPVWLAVIVLAVVGSGTVGFLASNAAIALALAYLFAGLGVLHAWLDGRKAKPLVLAGSYALLVLQPWLFVPVAGLGLVDQLVAWRRSARPTHTED